MHMEEQLIKYFNRIVDDVNDLIQVTLVLESKIHGVSDRNEHSKEFFLNEMHELKLVIQELDSLVSGLLVQFSQLSKSTDGFISKEEFEHLQTEVEKIQFEKLQLRTNLKEKVLKHKAQII
jgi:hypothetical protein